MARLIIVPTPIGNLGDITLRALEILKEAAVVFAEDTRTSSVLFQHYGIRAPMTAFHKNNEHRLLENAVARIASAGTAALITDAGTPGISDPGFLLVRACLAQGIEVECLPGPVAFIPALVVSGLPTDRFFFEGFLPQKKGRQTRLKELAAMPWTTVIYESPHRIARLIAEIAEHFGESRRISVSRELSKKFEETQRGTAGQLLARLPSMNLKGEFVVVTEGNKD